MYNEYNGLWFPTLHMHMIPRLAIPGHGMHIVHFFFLFLFLYDTFFSFHLYSFIRPMWRSGAAFKWD